MAFCSTIEGTTIRAIGLALLVLFFVVGVMRTCGSFAEVKKPEHALKLFIRFAIAKGVVTYGLELMMALFTIGSGPIQDSVQDLRRINKNKRRAIDNNLITRWDWDGY